MDNEELSHEEQGLLVIWVKPEALDKRIFGLLYLFVKVELELGLDAPEIGIIGVG
ncbi:MAG: hypothetical protein PUF62_10870 [Bacteroidales bacterium]|nr:hypothetical protein [Bacteroidales bacterium]